MLAAAGTSVSAADWAAAFGVAYGKNITEKNRYIIIGCFHLDYLVDLQTVILEIKRDGSRIGYESLSTGFPKLRITE